jgi:hypothetical protein
MEIDMTILKIIFSIFLLILISVAIFFNYIGFFSKVVIEEKQMGPFTLVYDEHKGDYKGTAKIQDNIYYSLLNDYKIETFHGFGIYYDDPKTVPTEKLRSIAGCILEKSDYEKIETLKEKGFKIKKIPKQNSVVVEFPFRNTFSIIAGIMKVYPKIEKYIEENNLTKNEMMEIYDNPSKKIIYLMKK